MKNINSRANHVAVKKKRGSWNWSLFVEVMNVWPQRFSLFQKKFRVPNVKKIKDIHFYKLHKNICHTKTSQGRRGRGAEGAPHPPTHTPPPPHTPFPEAKFFSHVKSEHVKFLHVKNISDLSLLIEHDISDKK